MRRHRRHRVSTIHLFATFQRVARTLARSFSRLPVTVLGKWDYVASALLTMSSPALDVYSFTPVTLNAQWLATKFGRPKKISNANKAARSMLQHSPNSFRKGCCKKYSFEKSISKDQIVKSISTFFYKCHFLSTKSTIMKVKIPETIVSISSWNPYTTNDEKVKKRVKGKKTVAV